MNAKTQASIYAQALYFAVDQKRGKALDDIVENFMSELKKNHKMHLVPEIIAELRKIHFAENGKISARVSSKEKLDSAVLSKITTLVKSNTGKSPELEENIDPNMLGGVTIKYDDKIVDLSLDSQLRSLAAQLSK